MSFQLAAPGNANTATHGSRQTIEEHFPDTFIGVLVTTSNYLNVDRIYTLYCRLLGQSHELSNFQRCLGDVSIRRVGLQQLIKCFYIRINFFVVLPRP